MNNQVLRGKPTHPTYLCAEYLSVQMDDAVEHGNAEFHHLVVREGGAVEVVVEGAELVVVSDEPQLSAGVARRHV